MSDLPEADDEEPRKGWPGYMALDDARLSVGEDRSCRGSPIRRRRRLSVGEDLSMPASEWLMQTMRRAQRHPRARVFSLADIENFVEMLRACLVSLPAELRPRLRLKRTANLTNSGKNSDVLVFNRDSIVAVRSVSSFEYGPHVALINGQMKKTYQDELSLAGWIPPEGKATKWFAPERIQKLFPARTLRDMEFGEDHFPKGTPEGLRYFADMDRGYAEADGGGED